MTDTTCAAHEPMRREIMAGISHLGEMMTSQIEGLREDLTRRMDESALDRKDLHEKHNSLSREVTTALTKLNGAILYKHTRDSEQVPALHRRSDDGAAWLKKNWLLLASIILAAFAGEKVIPALLGLIGKAFGIGGTP